MGLRTRQVQTTDGTVLAAVERKSLENFAAMLSDGTLAFQMQRLAELPLAAVVVESRYSALYKLEHIKGSWLADTRPARSALPRSPPRLRRLPPLRRRVDLPVPHYSTRRHVRPEHKRLTPTSTSSAGLSDLDGTESNRSFGPLYPRGRPTTKRAPCGSPFPRRRRRV
jgi:hypothetical protein